MPATPAWSQAAEGGDRTVRVALKELRPFVIPEDGGYDGFSIDLLNEIAARLEVDVDLIEVDTVDDQLEAVASGDADWAIAGISITGEREERVDFTHSMYNSGLQILTGRDDSPVVLRALKVLASPPLMALIAGLAVLMIVVGHVIWLIERRRQADFPRKYLRGVGEGIWWSAVTMTTVGYGDRTPKSPLGRGLAVLWMFMALILVANFTASVTSQLTVDDLRGTIGGPEDLPGSIVATVEGTSSVDYLDTIRVEVRAVGTIEEAYQLLEEDEVNAVVFDSPVLLNHAAKAGAGATTVVGPVFMPQAYGIAVPEGSPDRGLINSALLAIFEDGTYEDLRTKWFGGLE